MSSTLHFVGIIKIDMYMMKIIDIKNYKGFKHLALENLSRINLFVGKNNVGKSSLLEAISILCHKYNVPDYIFRNRNELLRSNEDGDQLCYRWLFPGFSDEVSEENKIEISSKEDGASASVSLQFTYYTTVEIRNSEGEIELQKKMIEGYQVPQDGQVYKKGMRIKTNDGVNNLHIFHPPFNISTSTYHQDGRVILRGSLRLQAIHKPCEYIQPSELTRIDNSGRFDAISVAGKEAFVIEALQIFNPDIEQLIYVGSPLRIPYVKLKGTEEKVPLRSMGDGINRVLTIVLAMIQCENDGVLLIDEFENGLHYTVQYQLWKIIYRLAEQLNIQVFVTSHSIDTLRGLSKLISDYPEDEMKEKVACYYLQNTKDNVIKSYRYDAANFEFLINQGEEIR